MGAVQYSRSGRPDLGVCRSRFKPLSYVLGLLVVEDLFIGYNDVPGPSKASLLGVERNRWSLG